MARKIRTVMTPKTPKRSRHLPVTDAERLCEREREAVLNRFVAPLYALNLDAIHARTATHDRDVSMVEYRSSRGTIWREGKVKP